MTACYTYCRNAVVGRKWNVLVYDSSGQLLYDADADDMILLMREVSVYSRLNFFVDHRLFGWFRTDGAKRERITS